MFPIKYCQFLILLHNSYGKIKPTVTPIVIPSDKLLFLRKKLDDPHVSQFIKRDFNREIMGGTCSIRR